MEFQRLEAWLERLQHRVHGLRTDRYIFVRIQQIIRHNRNLHVPSEFYPWLIRLYSTHTSIGVRREVDEDTRSDSFVRFLRSLKGNLGLISRQHYQNLWPQDERADANRAYDKLVGRGRPRPLASQIDRQIATLKRRSTNLATYADKIVAHADRIPPATVPRFRELTRVLRYLEELLQHYYILFRAVSLDVDVHFAYDWQAPFRVAWLEPQAGPLPNQQLHPSAGDE